MLCLPTALMTNAVTHNAITQNAAIGNSISLNAAANAITGAGEIVAITLASGEEFAR